MNIQTPNRKKHGYEQVLDAPPAVVFRLLCPVAEGKWVPGWKTEAVYSFSGLVEKGCVFLTPNEKHSSIWIVTKHDLATFKLEMFKVTPMQTVGKLNIALQAEGTTSTRAFISYEFTAIGEAGVTFLKEFTSEWYENFMQEWEDAMNHYLKTGERIA